jgi:hypothetical protein
VDPVNDEMKSAGLAAKVDRDDIVTSAAGLGRAESA